MVRNKTFFWAAGEGYRDGQSQNDHLHVPTAAMRSGDFSDFRDAQGGMIPIYDPLTTNASGNRTAVPGQHHSSQPDQPGRPRVRKRAAAADAASEFDDGNANLPAQDIIERRAQQGRSSSIITSTIKSR